MKSSPLQHAALNQGAHAKRKAVDSSFLNLSTPPQNITQAESLPTRSELTMRPPPQHTDNIEILANSIAQSEKYSSAGSKKSLGVERATVGEPTSLQQPKLAVASKQDASVQEVSVANARQAELAALGNAGFSGALLQVTRFSWVEMVALLHEQMMGQASMSFHKFRAFVNSHDFSKRITEDLEMKALLKQTMKPAFEADRLSFKFLAAYLMFFDDECRGYVTAADLFNRLLQGIPTAHETQVWRLSSSLAEALNVIPRVIIQYGGEQRRLQNGGTEHRLHFHGFRRMMHDLVLAADHIDMLKSKVSTCTIGDMVMAKYAGTGLWYAATVVSYDGGIFTVDWDNGDTVYREVAARDVQKGDVVCQSVVPTHAPADPEEVEASELASPPAAWWRGIAEVDLALAEDDLERAVNSAGMASSGIREGDLACFLREAGVQRSDVRHMTRKPSGLAYQSSRHKRQRRSSYTERRCSESPVRDGLVFAIQEAFADFSLPTLLVSSSEFNQFVDSDRFHKSDKRFKDNSGVKKYIQDTVQAAFRANGDKLPSLYLKLCLLFFDAERLADNNKQFSEETDIAPACSPIHDLNFEQYIEVVGRFVEKLLEQRETDAGGLCGTRLWGADRYHLSQMFHRNLAGSLFQANGVALQYEQANGEAIQHGRTNGQALLHGHENGQVHGHLQGASVAEEATQG